ncbi:MAG: hypothetical protein ACTTJK_07615 [Phocaeicola sp.]|uniref:hypothetical protein n=1 Tax=Phocaeicola TaxID=909656 RepID=UPI00234F782E|nr:hypothetical protein [Phocaeicola oris]MCE2616810.1 transposase [Phocaeicola oris]
MFKSGEKWTPSQRKRARILFAEYPDLQKAYFLSHLSVALCHQLQGVSTGNNLSPYHFPLNRKEESMSFFNIHWPCLF